MSKTNHGDPAENYRLLRDFSLREGAAVFGVAATEPERDDFPDLSPETRLSLSRAVVAGIPLARGVLDDIQNQPTRLYLHHYRQVNWQLDRLALEIARWIEKRGGKAAPIAASQIVDWNGQKGHLSHREMGRRAGLGWIGRNNLLITPAYGSALRLVTVLCDLPLAADWPLNRDCGDCFRCLAACPAGAIGNDPSEFNFNKCYEQLKIFKNSLGLGQYICGLCVKLCPASAPPNTV